MARWFNVALLIGTIILNYLIMEHKHQKQQYTCPMHPEIIREEPGNCSRCGMNLVRVKNSGKQDMNTKINEPMDHTQREIPVPVHTGTGERPSYGDDQPAIQQQRSQQYTCPMHPQIIRDEPGNCPLCGMTLISLKK